MRDTTDPSPDTVPNPSSAVLPLLTDGPLVNPSTGSPRTVTTRARAPGSPPLTGDCQPPDTASSPGAPTFGTRDST